MMPINKKTVREYASRYSYSARFRGNNDESVENEIAKRFKRHRYLDKASFLKIALWKSKRPKQHYESNDDATIREITEFSLRTKSEAARIKVLLALNGVSYPLASVILHFAFPNKYPILDFRALWSLGWKQPKSYNFAFWQRYCRKIRAISKLTGESMRTVDKALWQYSKEHQKK